MADQRTTQHEILHGHIDLRAQTSGLSLVESDAHQPVPNGQHIPPALIAPEAPESSNETLPRAAAVSQLAANPPSSINRKKSVQSLSPVPAELASAELPPMLCRADRLWTAKRELGYTIERIAQLSGLSARTVQRVFRLDSGVSFFAVCVVVNLLKLEMADVFPSRHQEPVALSDARALAWTAGPEFRKEAS